MTTWKIVEDAAEGWLIEVDGIAYGPDWHLSRLLTGTVYEIGCGIFNTYDAQVRFEDMAGRQQHVDFGESWFDFLDCEPSLHEIVIEITNRISLVQKAFT
jgi:hypothetical protein